MEGILSDIILVPIITKEEEDAVTFPAFSLRDSTDQMTMFGSENSVDHIVRSDCSSPVSSLSDTLSGMSVLPPKPLFATPVSPSFSPYTKRFSSTSSVRRRLSLSLDLQATNFTETSDSPPTSPHLISPLSPRDQCSDQQQKSPSKTTKRSFCFDEDGDILHATSRPARRSFPCILQDIKNKPISRLNNENSGSRPLRRSTSALQFPRPWCGDDVSDAAPVTKEVLPHEKTTILPTMSGTHPDLNCISADTVIDVLSGVYKDQFADHFVIDCRFPYEFEGGHIKGALNLTEEEVQERFMTNPIKDRKVCIIFHCEFSSKRAPSSYRALRDSDRRANFAEYPKLHYPEVYYIHGGYKQFYEKFPNYCVGSYVEMRDENHTVQYRQCNKTKIMSKLRRSSSLRRLSISAECYSPSQLMPNPLLHN